MQRGNIPYRNLGKELQRIRQRSQESTAEVSGAVEIDIERLDQYERGEARPSEDILLLLITHFGVKDETAAKLWELAGYGDNNAHGPIMDGDPILHQQVAMILPIDSRIVYSDMVNITSNKYGVVMNFLQSDALQGQPLRIARIGMSHEHARSVLDVLQKTLAEASKPKHPKALQAPKARRSRTDKK